MAAPLGSDLGRGSCAVALPLPAAHPYRYHIPVGLSDRIAPGARVVVPVRTREMIGVVVEVREETDAALRPVLLVADPEPLVPPGLLELAHWVSRYYAAPIGLTLRAMLPTALWGRSRLIARLRQPAGAASVDDATGGNGVGREAPRPEGAAAAVLDHLERMGGRAAAARLTRALQHPVWDALQRLARLGLVELEVQPPRLGPRPGTERTIRLTRSLTSLLERDQVFGRAARQRAAYDTIDSLGGEAVVRHLVDQLGFSPALLRGLVRRGVAVLATRPALRDPFRHVVAPPPAEPTAAQRDALEAVRRLPAGGAGTLFGVTGSGKTLVYLEALREPVMRGAGAIVLVPEIALTPQTVARVRGVFGDAVAVLHSALSDAERADAWRAVASGQRRVVVGARSAVFAPVPRLAAIVVDEEHDASYKNGEVPRYHARDVALRRGRIEDARVILGSATPSLETWAARDRLPAIRLPHRVGAPGLPPVRLVDLRIAPRVPESGAVPWSVELDRVIAARLAAGEQALLLLNRRGFANYLQCPACGEVSTCRSCSIPLTVHRVPSALRCHYCGHQEPVPERCRRCTGVPQQMRGVGTQALERWLSERFPGARLARMDADTTTARWSHARILDAVARGDVDLLLGTQMIAKGLDFPNVTVVGVVDADTALHLPDFRAAERTFQLIAQVAGRAGRGPKGGEVLIQTRNPEHYALQAAASHDYERFAAQELDARSSPAYPPHVSLANVLVSGLDEAGVASAAGDLTSWLQGLIVARANGMVEVLGPAPAPLARIKRRWRWHLVLRASDRAWLGRVLRYAAHRAPHSDRRRGAVRVVLDRDPVSLL